MRDDILLEHDDLSADGTDLPEARDPFEEELLREGAFVIGDEPEETASQDETPSEEFSEAEASVEEGVQPEAVPAEAEQGANAETDAPVPPEGRIAIDLSEEENFDDEFAAELARRERARSPEEKPVVTDKYRSMADKFDSNVDYTTVLSNFEGPLDLLLYLINREEIEIKDIFVSQVTEQFLDYMKGLPYLDVDKVTDYLNIAATIIKIKAQSLVPVLEDMEDYYEDDYEDDKAELIRALEEYRLIKEEMTKLKELETIGYYFKEPDKDVGETKTVFSLDNLTLEGLVKAMSALLVKRENALEEEETREIPRDEYTVEQKILFILEVFEEAEEIRFEQLFTEDFTKSEIVTTFQALLELLKHQYLMVRQPELFGQIYIRFNPESSHTWVGQQIDEYE